MLHIHRAERADALLDMLGDLVAVPLGDPMVAEVVAVPTRGVERWLAQQLATRLGATPGRHDGVCANIEFPFPGTLVGRATAAASGMDPATDPWAAERSVWPLLEVVDLSLDEPWLAPLAAHLRGSGPEGETRRFAGVRHVADLFDRYTVHRPVMVRAWAEGSDAGADGQPLPADAAWQPALWRALRDRVGIPSPAERLTADCARLREAPELVDIPGRVSLFGLTRLPASYLEVLASIATGRDAHLFLLHPSPALWDRVADAIGTAPPPSRRRADDATVRLVANPLLVSWGRDAREMQLVIAAEGGEGVVDHHQPLDPAPDSLLGRIQSDIRADRPAAGLPLPAGPDTRALLDPDDRSIQIHACHGRGRQVEVVRDAILHLLAADPTLEPRDVIVMCPDIEAYAPLIHATFGAGRSDDDDGLDDAQGMPELRVRLADRSLRQTNPILGVVATLLEVAQSRVTASELLDLAGRDPVRRRFGFDVDDTSRIERWITATGVRWGFDGAHRAPFSLAGLEAGTWRSGLDRALLGATMADADQRMVGGVVPLDDVDSGDIMLVGRYAELVARLQHTVDAFSGPKSLAAWAQAIATAADALCATAERDAWQRSQLQYLLDDIVDAATTDEVTVGAPLALAEVASLLADRLRGRPTRANFRTGQLTICTLVPMRSVPHRVVCLLGLDDGVFPRAGERDGDDLILADPCVGDRDARSEDRQLLLDALLAATDHLVVTYSGRDERTNAERPPSVPLGELLDVIDRTVRPIRGGRARDRVVVHHPLQPFDARNFRPGALVPGSAWSFDTVNLEGAVVRDGPRISAVPFLTAALPDPPGTAIELAQLERFVRHPAKALLRDRFGIFLDDRGDETDDALPVELDALAEWGIGDRLLAARLAGADPEACAAAEQARGLLPPGGLGAPVLRRVAGRVEGVVALSESVGGPHIADSLDVNVEFPGWVLTGVVPGVMGNIIRTATYSRLGPAQRLIAWVRLLAVSATHPERPFESVTVGRAAKGQGCATARVPVLAAGQADRRAVAVAELTHLAGMMRRGMREPVPLACKTSAAWVSGGRDPAKVARREWEGDFKWPGEAADAEHRLVFGGTVAFDRLLEELPRSDEGGEGWAGGETTRFGRYARALWDPLLARESVETT